MSGNGVKIALALSLALNLFVIGAVAGALGMRARQEIRPAAAAPGGNPLLRAGDALPAAVRQAYRAQLRQATAASQAQLAEARQARADLARILAEPDFDPAAAMAALGRAREAELAARAQVEAALVSFAQTAGPAQRRIIARSLAQDAQGAGQGRGGPLGGPGGPAGPPPPPAFIE